MRYIIAELGIELNLKYDYANRRMKDYKSEFGGTHIRINIEEDNAIVLPEYTEQIPYQFKNYWLKFADDSFGAFRTLVNSDYIIFFARWNKDATEATIKMADVTRFGGKRMELREFSYVGEVLRFMLPFHNRMVLHSSALALDNHGVAFSAVSGTGKSTHANAWKRLFPDCIAINDDAPVVYNNGSGFRLYGQPWSGKTAINANISAPLDAIVCLYQDKTNHIEQIPPRKSFPFLLDGTVPTPLNEREERKISILSDVISNTKIYMLGCLPDNEAAIICKEKIWKEM
ncbi:MAG: hypothetical protein IJN62_05175 [Clostridia bacterium]|nr:hypothetical protein [Clostridia bacterium]